MSRVNTKITVTQVKQLCDSAFLVHLTSPNQLTNIRLDILRDVLPGIQCHISLEDKKQRLEACIQVRVSVCCEVQRLSFCLTPRQAITPVAKDVNDTSRLLAQLRTNNSESRHTCSVQVPPNHIVNSIGIGVGQVAAWNEMDVSLQQVKQRMICQAQFSAVDVSKIFVVFRQCQ